MMQKIWSLFLIVAAVAIIAWFVSVGLRVAHHGLVQTLDRDYLEEMRDGR